MFSGVRGALANATIGACALFGAICGSSIATAATFSKVAIPEMRRHGYEPAFAAGAVAARRHARRADPALGAARDLRHRRRAVAAQALRGGVHPGLRARGALRARGVDGGLAAAALGAEGAAACRFAARLRASLGMWKLGVLFFFAVFGIYLGWFSPTEAAAVAAFAAILIAIADAADGLARPGRCAARDRLHHRGDLLHRGRRLHLLALHRADAVPERARRLGASSRASAPVWILLGGDGALRRARHLPRRGEHHPDHRAGDAAAGRSASATTASGSASSSP